jgi:hypothetical protein
MRLGPSQEIVYFRNGDEIFRINPQNVESFSEGVLGYIERVQPFVNRGQRLFIPISEAEVLETGKIVKREVLGNRIEYSTDRSVYVIHYLGINLEKILRG